MLEQNLQLIIEKMGKYGFLLNNGVDSNDVLLFNNAVSEKFQYSLPSEYLDFLMIMNGFDFNGAIIYGVDIELVNVNPNHEISGFMSYNETWYENEWLRQYIFFGEGEMNWYVFNLSNNQFQLLDKPSGSLIEVFSTFNALIDYIFEEVLR